MSLHNAALGIWVIWHLVRWENHGRWTCNGLEACECGLLHGISQHLHGDTDAPMTNLGHVGSIGSNPVKT